jgi:hypothetical protein
MTRKHYQDMALDLRTDLENGEIPREHVSYAARAFADVAARDNSRFNRSRFFESCGLDSAGR